jgi:hypothetical protein
MTPLARTLEQILRVSGYLQRAYHSRLACSVPGEGRQLVQPNRRNDERLAGFGRV